MPECARLREGWGVYAKRFPLQWNGPQKFQKSRPPPGLIGCGFAALNARRYSLRRLQLIPGLLGKRRRRLLVVPQNGLGWLRQKRRKVFARSGESFCQKWSNSYRRKLRRIPTDGDSIRACCCFFGKPDSELFPHKWRKRDGDPWFVAADVCRVLEIEPTATRRLDEDEKITLRLTQGESNRTSDTTIINEPGLYALVLGSRKPEAKPFKRQKTRFSTLKSHF